MGGRSRFTAEYHHVSAATDFTATVGLWMHREPLFSQDAIADWLGQPYEGEELLEPINVLWVDLVAHSETEARDSVVEFLGDCGFDREGDVFFGQIPRHSSGYYASYGRGIWREQYDPDDAWVGRRGVLPLDTDHGRIFPAFGLAGGATTVFLTSGAFSQEGPLGTFNLVIDCLFSRERCHPFRSFNAARDALACGAPGWSRGRLVNLGNAVPLSSPEPFSTADHDGVLVFERSPRSALGRP